MRIFVLVLLFVVCVNANCGCLKCSPHLQGVQIPGPNGCPIKVVFKKPGKFDPNVYYQPFGGDCGGQQYSATLQAPVAPSNGRVPIPLLDNLQYRTDTVLIPPPADVPPPEAAPEISPEIINFLKNILANSPRPQGPLKPYSPGSGPVFERLRTNCDCNCDCNCNRLAHFPFLSTSFSDNNDEEDNDVPSCLGSYKRYKRSLDDSRPFVSKGKSRGKRDLAKHGYKFLMNMLPQFIRDPLHHSIQGVHVESNKPKLTFKEKLEEIKMKKALKNLYGQEESQSDYLLPRNAPYYRHQNQHLKQSFNDHSNHFWNVDQQKTKPKHSWQKQTDLFGSPFETPSYSRKVDTFKNLKYSFIEDKPQQTLFGKSKQSLMPALSDIHDPFLDGKFKSFEKKYYSTPKLFPRTKENEDSTDETRLLRKLKRLNRNPFSSDIEDQATTFVQDLLQPGESDFQRTRRSTESKSRPKRSTTLEQDLLQPKDSEDKRLRRSIKSNSEKILSRPKRTIILSSDEIDLPAHYEVDFVSAEDEDNENMPDNFQSSEEYDDENPIVGYSPFLEKLPSRRLHPRLQPKPDVIMGKNVIQKAVREELNTYHKKLEREQKIKEMKENLQRKQQKQSLVPQNPIFMLLTAPMHFLKHFHDINKGVNPVMTSLPKLVYTTKKYFRDFGKNFQKNCLNLASDIIGDFDHIDPNVIQEIPKPAGGRHRRNALEDELIKKCLEEYIGTNAESPVNVVENNQIVKENNTEFFHETLDEKATEKSNAGPQLPHFAPDYTATFKNSIESQNFREVPDNHVRKKRYVIKVVDDDEIQDQVEDYLTQKMDDQFSYLKPLQDYYDKVNDFIVNLYSNHQPLAANFNTESPYYQQQEDSFEDSYETKPKKKKIQIKKIKPRVIIDNKGLPFMEYDGYKRPLLLNRKKIGMLKKSGPQREKSSEETGSKIATLIARAREDSEVVGGAQRDIIPPQIVKERISSLLEEIDQLVHLNAEDYDEIFEDLIKIQHIKTSIEQDWKRILIDDRVDDIGAKIGLLSKFKDLQQVKDDSVKNIAEALEKNDNEFVRKQLVHSLIRLQKLQCLITSVVEDFDQHLTMKTSFNTKKEIKYVDFLSQLKFVYAKTRNDLVKKLCQDRDAEGQKNIESLHKLKKLLMSSEEDPEKFDHAAKLLWEMRNLEKLQKQTIQDMNQKLSRRYKIKKELKILFDLQKRFEDCEMELNELLGNLVVKATLKLGQKKDVKRIIAEIKQKHDEILQKAKGRLKNS